MDKSKDQIYCKDILQAIDDIESFTAVLNFEDFAADRKTQMAVTRGLEIIGEAAKKLSKEFKKENERVPWRRIAGMRDFLIHDYGKVDLRKVWNAATEDIKELKATVEKAIWNEENLHHWLAF